LPRSNNGGNEMAARRATEEMTGSGEFRRPGGFTEISMSRSEVEGVLFQDTRATSRLVAGDASEHPSVAHDERLGSVTVARRRIGPQRTPRRSLIVVLPDNHVLPASLVADLLPADSGGEEMDVIIACAGQPASITELQRLPDLAVLLAPAGTSIEDLRELAMRRAPGDIVTLLSGTSAQP
jgi:hypothetical protein